MKSLLVSLTVCVAAGLALPAERWPNVIGAPSKRDLVVITPTSDYGPTEHGHIIPNKDTIFHSSYSAIEQIYPSPNHHHPPPPKSNPHYDEKVLRKYYNDHLNKKVAFKKAFIQKAVDKTVDVTAKLTQYTVDFLSRIAIETAAKLAKTGANHVIHKKDEKYHH